MVRISQITYCIVNLSTSCFIRKWHPHSVMLILIIPGQIRAYLLPGVASIRTFKYYICSVIQYIFSLIPIDQWIIPVPTIRLILWLITQVYRRILHNILTGLCTQVVCINKPLNTCTVGNLWFIRIIKCDKSTFSSCHRIPILKTN